MNLQELKIKKPPELLAFAEEQGVEGAAMMRRQELMFAILQKVAAADQAIFGVGTIEVAPLAYMRGRTLNDSFIILDEAQNTSAEQMKMFLTRLGFGSQVVVTGDVTQVDLPSGQTSGLRVVQDILEGVPDIHFARLTSHDVVRHRLVGEIVDAYERYDARQRDADEAAGGPRRGGSRGGGRRGQ